MKRQPNYLTESILSEFSYDQLTDVFILLDEILTMKRSDLNTRKKRCQFFFDNYGSASYSHMLNKTRPQLSASLATKVYAMAAKLNGELYEMSGKVLFDDSPEEPDATASAWYRNNTARIKYFVYYYVTNIKSFPFPIHKAVLALNLNKGVYEANLVYYWRRGRDDYDKPIPVPPSTDVPVAAYWGSATPHRERLCLHFTSRKDHGREPEKRMSMMWLNSNEQDVVSTRKKIAATYVSFDPACGVGILVPGSYSEVFAKIQDPEIPPLISKYLIARKITLKGSANTTLDLGRQNEILSKVSKYNGVYHGYVMSTKKGKNFIDTLKVEITDGHQIRLVSVENSSELKGYVFNFSRGSMNCLLGFDNETEIYSTNLTLKVPGDIDEFPSGTLCGIYGGFRTLDNSPKVGRLIICRARPGISFDQISPKRIDLGKTEEAEAFLQDKAFLVRYFASDYDKFVDAPKVIAQDGFRKLYDKIIGEKDEQEEASSEITEYAGLYLSFSRSFDGLVYQLPIKITPSGEVIRLYFSGPKETIIKAFIGNVRIFQSSVLCLSYHSTSFYINNKVSKSQLVASRHSHFDLGSSKVIAGHLVYEGATLDINRSLTPSTLKEYIYQIPGDEHAQMRPLAQVYDRTSNIKEEVIRELVGKLLEKKSST
jgi:hypothetical protein